jgi:penicillin-binding protein 2
MRRSGRMPIDVPIETTVEVLHQRIAESWQKVSDLTGEPTWPMYQAADRIVERLRAMQERYSERTGYNDDIAEQEQFHPVLRDVPAETANRLRLELADYPWFRVHTSTSRLYVDEPAVCHLVGRLADVTQEAVERDPNRGDKLRELIAGERVGETGVERAAEHLLRGQRGLVVRNRAGDYPVNVEPVRGRDVHLTIDLDLQRWIFDRLERAVKECPTASSGSAVVLDVHSREVRAVVSWPGYTQREYAEERDRLLRDRKRQPLRFHAMADCFAAGSIVKPITVIAAMSAGVTTPHERIDCTGYLFPEVRNAFRCWTVSRGMDPHGSLNAREAIQHSCNIYCYTMGRRLGVQRECEWFDMFGLGRSPGTGLVEEAVGVLPTPGYLAKRYGHTFGPAELATAATNFAIGQGDVMLTPMQAANLGATIATGVWQPVVLFAEQAEASRAARKVLPVAREHWRAAREGMFDVVNAPTGTARKFAYSEGLEIAGKTGTAQTGPRIISYIYQLTMHDGSIRTVEFDDSTAAADKIALMGEAVVKWERKGERYWPGPPDPKHQPNHAWFMAFAPAHKPEVAVAVLIEYGMAGGGTAGPVAQDILEHIFGVKSSHRAISPVDMAPTD